MEKWECCVHHSSYWEFFSDTFFFIYSILFITFKFVCSFSLQKVYFSRFVCSFLSSSLVSFLPLLSIILSRRLWDLLTASFVTRGIFRSPSSKAAIFLSVGARVHHFALLRNQLSLSALLGISLQGFDYLTKTTKNLN